MEWEDYGEQTTSKLNLWQSEEYLIKAHSALMIACTLITVLSYQHLSIEGEQLKWLLSPFSAW